MKDEIAKARSLGGRARAKSLSAERRSEIGRLGGIGKKAKALEERHARATRLPEARYKGVLSLLDVEIPVYVLDDGRRVIGRTAATEMLTSIKGGGALEKYLGAARSGGPGKGREGPSG